MVWHVWRRGCQPDNPRRHTMSYVFSVTLRPPEVLSPVLVGLRLRPPSVSTYSTSLKCSSPTCISLFGHSSPLRLPCDRLILLVLEFSCYYSTIPFCISLFGTEFVGLFFGMARQLLPNFSYVEFLNLVQLEHIMVRQRTLESCFCPPFLPQKSRKAKRSPKLIHLMMSLVERTMRTKVVAITMGQAPRTAQ